MSPRALGRILDRFQARTGALGVALGRKDPDDPDSPPVVAFIVRKKQPRRGSRTRVANGARAVPKTVTVGKRRLKTDVVAVTAAARPKERGPAPESAAAPLVAGDPISNLSATGTFGCLVRRAGDAALYALTNRHVAFGPGTRMFFPGGSEGETAFTADKIEDERFQPFIDEPESYFDVDAALVRIPPADEHRFSNLNPGIGPLTGIFDPDESSREAYARSVIGTPVSAVCWNTGRREGVVSHVLFVTRESPTDPQLVYSHLIRSTDGMPRLNHDSGKIWFSESAGERRVVGLHQGVVTLDAEPSRLAVATDFRALARLLGIRLA
jgi:hypothetical protein